MTLDDGQSTIYIYALDFCTDCSENLGHHRSSPFKLYRKM